MLKITRDSLLQFIILVLATTNLIYNHGNPRSNLHTNIQRQRSFSSIHTLLTPSTKWTRHSYTYLVVEMFNPADVNLAEDVGMGVQETRFQVGLDSPDETAHLLLSLQSGHTGKECVHL